jgi:hypothetical protein
MMSICLSYVVLYLIGDDDIPGIGQYDDFHTIDWQRDIARDRMRHRYIVKKRQDSLWDLLKVRLVCYLKFIVKKGNKHPKTTNNGHKLAEGQKTGEV